MLLRGTKVDFIENINEQDELEQKEEASLDNNCFFFTWNKYYSLLYAPNRNFFSRWRDKLSSCCILSYFSKNY